MWTPSGPSSYPTSSQPALGPDFLKSLYSQVDDQESQNLGNASTEAIARGTTGSPFQSTLEAGATQGASVARNSALQGYLYNLAGMQEQENIRGEEQQYGTAQRQAQETWQGGQNDLNRALQEKLGIAGLEEQSRLQNMQDTYGLYYDLLNPMSGSSRAAPSSTAPVTSPGGSYYSSNPSAPIEGLGGDYNPDEIQFDPSQYQYQTY